jgi:hypothetical protein
MFVVTAVGMSNVFFSMTSKMQRHIIFFIIVNALHVSSGFSAHHQEFKTVHTASGICQTWFAATASMGHSDVAFGTFASPDAKLVLHAELIWSLARCEVVLEMAVDEDQRSVKSQTFSPSVKRAKPTYEI